MHTPYSQVFPKIGLSRVNLAVTGERIVATCPKSLVASLISWVAAKPLVRFVDERETFTAFNDVASTGIQSTDGFSTPIWERGLRGQGQVIGIADTVSMHVCMSYLCLCVRVVRACVCVYIYIYIYIYIYTYIYIHIYVNIIFLQGT